MQGAQVQTLVVELSSYMPCSKTLKKKKKKKPFLLSSNIIEDNYSWLRQEHQMQYVILTIPQIGKGKGSNKHNADCWRNLNMDYIYWIITSTRC